MDALPLDTLRIIASHFSTRDILHMVSVDRAMNCRRDSLLVPRVSTQCRPSAKVPTFVNPSSSRTTKIVYARTVGGVTVGTFTRNVIMSVIMEGLTDSTFPISLQGRIDTVSVCATLGLKASCDLRSKKWSEVTIST